MKGDGIKYTPYFGYDSYKWTKQSDDTNQSFVVVVLRLVLDKVTKIIKSDRKKWGFIHFCVIYITDELE